MSVVVGSVGSGKHRTVSYCSRPPIVILRTVICSSCKRLILLFIFHPEVDRAIIPDPAPGCCTWDGNSPSYIVNLTKEVVYPTCRSNGICWPLMHPVRVVLPAYSRAQVSADRTLKVATIRSEETSKSTMRSLGTLITVGSCDWISGLRVIALSERQERLSLSLSTDL